MLYILFKNKLKDDTKYSTVFFSQLFNSWLCGLLLNSNNKTCNSLFTKTKYQSKKCQQDQYEQLWLQQKTSLHSDPGALGAALVLTADSGQCLASTGHGTCDEEAGT